ncbi:MAG: hypothetical protein ONB48_00625 [candidate division KSB1 bacterium]|nr:hypothetical protein [candidate division KSB1 bacterium]MDZ7272818.1 hypothetical protein [candidate division KSB1 bacterium]MDZ7284158.1 hypothetical protein [candidate division KSB1 bacterium]MDZ7297444.1 hypothetical protein [candidate division KSB1 bacterium]MDZ7305580.1 hypothetical protein [candidate division KSB1 bacterium]
MKCKLIPPAAGWLACWSLILFLSPPANAQDRPHPAFQLRALQAAAGQPSVYELSFTAASALAPTAEFILEFPASFDLRKAKIAGCEQLPGGFTVTAAAQKLRLRRTGRGPAVAAGTAITLRVSAIVNPDDLSAVHLVRLQIRPQASAAVVDLAPQAIAFERAPERVN